jgi:hypothetical protein
LLHPFQVSVSAPTGCRLVHGSQVAAGRSPMHEPGAVRLDRPDGASDTIALFWALTLRPPSASKARETLRRRPPDKTSQVEIGQRSLYRL